MKLTPLTESDTPILNQWYNDPKIAYYMLTEVPNPRHRIISWGIRLDDGTLVGWETLENIDFNNLKAEFGIAIPDKKYRRLAGFAIKQAFFYGFNQLGLNRIYLRPLATNVKPYPDDSRDGFGFVREGVERQSVKRGDKYEDVIVFSMLKDEFERRWG